jgi:hypothetical protein
MKRINAVIEKAEICRIGDPFLKKPPDLGLAESDALMVTARTVDGRRATATFYLSLKPDGTFEEDALGARAMKAGRRRLASFLKYYKIIEDISNYKFKEKLADLRGRRVEVIAINGDAAIYIPEVIPDDR